MLPRIVRPKLASKVGFFERKVSRGVIVEAPDSLMTLSIEVKVKGSIHKISD
jgi:hypothetical protein